MGFVRSSDLADRPIVRSSDRPVAPTALTAPFRSKKRLWGTRAGDAGDTGVAGARTARSRCRSRSRAPRVARELDAAVPAATAPTRQSPRVVTDSFGISRRSRRSSVLQPGRARPVATASTVVLDQRRGAADETGMGARQRPERLRFAALPTLRSAVPFRESRRSASLPRPPLRSARPARPPTELPARPWSRRQRRRRER